MDNEEGKDFLELLLESDEMELYKIEAI